MEREASGKKEKSEKSMSENILRVLKLMTAKKSLLNYCEEVA